MTPNLIRNSILVALDYSSKIYIHVIPVNDVYIGERGFIGDEVDRGIILSLGENSCVDLDVNEVGLFAKLKFSGVWEDVYIPYGSIISVLDDLQSPEFVFSFRADEDEFFDYEDGDKEVNIEDKIVKIDFNSGDK